MHLYVALLHALYVFDTHMQALFIMLGCVDQTKIRITVITSYTHFQILHYPSLLLYHLLNFSSIDRWSPRDKVSFLR